MVLYAAAPMLLLPANCAAPPCSCHAAPITAANLLLNAKSGLYNGAPLSVSGNAVLVDVPDSGKGAAASAAAGAAQAAEDGAAGEVSPSGEFVPAGSSGGGSGRQRAVPAALPLEILAQGDFEPLYRSPLDVRSGELPVLPLSIYGAGGWAGQGRAGPGGQGRAWPLRREELCAERCWVGSRAPPCVWHAVSLEQGTQGCHLLVHSSSAPHTATLLRPCPARTVAMAHLPDTSAGYVSGLNFFIYKFDRQQVRAVAGRKQEMHCVGCNPAPVRLSSNCVRPSAQEAIR